jgi:hypothetical protein
MRRLFAGFGIVGFLASPALAQSTPEVFVRGVYDAYVAAEKAGKDAPDQLRASIYSARIRKQIAALKKACAKREDLCLPDADFLVDGQDYKISDIHTKELSQQGDRAKVEARFRNFDTAVVKTYTLVRENGRWAIDDIDGGLRELLKPLPSSR